MTRLFRFVSTGLICIAAACSAADMPAGTALESRVAATCEPMGRDVSAVSFSDEQATAAIDMADGASLEELEALDGVGPSIARRIAAARPFRAHADPLAALDDVAYVGPRVLASFRDGAFQAWCALDDGRQACCVDVACAGGGVEGNVEVSDAEAHAVLDWANRATTDELIAVCRVGPEMARLIEQARPIRSVAELAAVRYVGDATLRHMVGQDGYLCPLQGSVFEEWCGLADASCACEPADDEVGFVLDEDAATGFAEELAGVFYADNADFVWEEYCEAAYDHASYDQADAQAACDPYVSERFFIASIQAALGLAGTRYADEDAARTAIAELVDVVFFANVDDWMAGFEAALAG